MKESQKIYIKGNKDRGDEIEAILTGLGATPVAGIDCDNDQFLYFIDHDNEICIAIIDSEVGRIIMDNYKEIELPQQPWKEWKEWKDGDILIDDYEPKRYAVFKEHGKGLAFRAYFVLLDKTAYFDTPANVRHLHLASTEEVENLPSLFRLLICGLNDAYLHFPKKGEWKA